MKRITIVSALLALAVLAALTVVVPSVYASSSSGTCPLLDATLTGNYAFIQPSGFLTNKKTGTFVPWQFVGVATFDGTGGISVSYTAVVNGEVFNVTSSGIYSVKSDCTGSMTIPKGVDTFDIVIIGGGAELFGIFTSAPDTATFIAKKQDATQCTVATLTGNYAIIRPGGFLTDQAGIFVPWQFVGVETFDGTGGISVSYTAALNGEIFKNKNSSGTYSVESDCTGSLSFTSGDAAGNSLNIVIIDGGAEIFGIWKNSGATSGATATFVAKKQ